MTTPNTDRLLGRLRLALVPAAAVFLVACASTPTSTPALDQARALYAQAAADPNAARSAPLELRSAQQALSRAESALKAGEDMTAVEHYAYLARQRASTALQAADIARSEQAVAASSGQRDRILIDARSREADQRTVEAQTARMQAEKDRAAAELARQQAQKASMDADQARQSAEAQLAAAQAAQAKNAKLQAQLAELQAKQTERGMVLTLGDVLFDTGRAVLKDGALRTVDQLVAFLKDNPERTLAIEGYTDAVGSDAYNLGLSQKRAEAVKTALTQRGVDAARVSAQGLGEASPVASNTTAEGRQRNRRVEIVISHTK